MSSRDLWVVHSLLLGLHLALKAETMDAATNSIYLCSKMHVIFPFSRAWDSPRGWALLSPILYLTFSSRHCQAAAVQMQQSLLPPTLLGTKGLV